MRDSHLISLFGPLTLELNLKIGIAPTLVGDSHFAKSRGIHYGGSLLKITRCLQNLGYLSNVFGYTGNDEYANAIADIIKLENLNVNLQKIPNTSTQIACKLFDNKSSSSFITQMRDLNLWRLRIKQAQLNNNIIFLDPSIPSQMQLEIIEQHKKTCTFIVSFPTDENLKLFSTTANLIILLSEVSAFKVFLQIGKQFFEEAHLLKSEFFQKHHVILESKKTINLLNASRDHIAIDLDKLRMNSDVMNDYFVAGLICGLLSKQDLQMATSCGIVTALKNAQNQIYTKTDVLNESRKMEWYTVK